MNTNIKHGKGLWNTIKDIPSVEYSSSKKIDFNEIFKEIQKQNTDNYRPIMPVSPLTYKFMTAHATNDEELLQEAQNELKDQMNKMYQRISEKTKLSVEQIKTLCDKYHHTNHHDAEKWQIYSQHIGDKDNEYDDRYIYVYLMFRKEKWEIYIEWTDGYNYEKISENVLKLEDIVEKFL